MAKIVISMDGGLIQFISADEPVEIYVVDYDVEGTETDDPYFTQLNGDDCLLFPWEPDINPGHVSNAIKTWKIAAK